MDTSSKRDIYDLIAELAKSADMDLEGTEFAPEKIDMRRKPGLPSTEEKVITEVEQSIPERHIVVPQNKERNGTPVSGSDYSESISSQPVSLEQDLVELRQRTLEELSEIKKFILHELNEKRKPTNEESGQVNTEKITSTDDNSPRNATPTSYREIVTAADEIQELKASHRSLLEELQKLKSLYSPTPPQDSSVSNSSGDQALLFSIEKLNRITTALNSNHPGSRGSISDKHTFEEEEAEKRKRELSNDLIIDQLMLINEKIDEMQTHNLKGEIVQEIKRSDDRLLDQMKRNKDDVLLGLLSIKEQKITLSNNAIMRLLGFVNLLLLLIVMIYLFVSKMTAQTTSKVDRTLPLQPTEYELPATFNAPPAEGNTQDFSPESASVEKKSTESP